MLLKKGRKERRKQEGKKTIYVLPRNAVVVEDKKDTKKIQKVNQINGIQEKRRRNE